MGTIARERSVCAWRTHRRASPPAAFPWDVAALLRRCSSPVALPMGAALIRSALTESEQRSLYDELLRLAGSELVQEMRAFKVEELEGRPQAFVAHCHPYTRHSNTARGPPSQLLRWAQWLLDELAPGHGQRVDSMVAQLYVKGGGLLPHVDADLGWGLQISLGGTARFDCIPDGMEPVGVQIRSGDILVGQFGRMKHEVRVSLRETAPRWWRAEVDNLGRERCNVLFRQALSRDELRALADRRARALHGLSFDELLRRTGEDEGLLAARLRHTAVN